MSCEAVSNDYLGKRSFYQDDSRVGTISRKQEGKKKKKKKKKKKEKEKKGKGWQT